MHDNWNLINTAAVASLSSFDYIITSNNNNNNNQSILASMTNWDIIETDDSRYNKLIADLLSDYQDSS